jgi:hypothetical protein
LRKENPPSLTCRAIRRRKSACSSYFQRGIRQPELGEFAASTGYSYSSKGSQRARLVGTGIPANVLRAIFPEKQANSGGPLVYDYICYRNPDNSATICGNVDVLSSGCFVVLTATCSGGWILQG